MLLDLAATADPDAALRGLALLLEPARRRPGARRRPARRRAAARRLLDVLGASPALADHLVRHPEHWRAGRDVRPSRRRAAAAHAAGGRRRLPATRRAGRTGLPRAATRCGSPTGAPCSASPRATSPATSTSPTSRPSWPTSPRRPSRPRWPSPAAELPAGRARPAGWPSSRWASAAAASSTTSATSTSCSWPRPCEGADEAAGAARRPPPLAAAMMRVCSATTAEGTIWPVDAALRPGGQGRAAGADAGQPRRLLPALGQDLGVPGAAQGAPGRGRPRARARRTSTRWRRWCGAAAERDDFVVDVQQMRRRVEQTLPAARQPPRAQARARRPARRGVRRPAAAARARPHRRDAAQPQHPRGARGAVDLRLRRPRRRRRAGPRLPVPAHRRAPAAAAPAAAHPRHARRRGRAAPARPLARPAHRPGRGAGPRSGASTPARCAGCTRSSSTGRCCRRWRGSASDEARLTPEAARSRLEALGYEDPAGALRHLEALTAGVSRRAAIQRTLLPVLLGWFADAPDPDGGLLAFRRLSDALGTTPWYLRLLRDEGAVAHRLALLLASSRYAVDLLGRAPEAVRLLADDAELVPRGRAGAGRRGRCRRRPARRPGERRRGGPGRTPARAVPGRGSRPARLRPPSSRSRRR